MASGPLTSRVPGVVVGGPLAIAEAIGWTPDACGSALGALETAEMIVADRVARIVYLPDILRADCSRPSSTSAAAMWRRELFALPACALRERIESDAGGIISAMGEAWARAFADGVDPKKGERPSKGKPNTRMATPPLPFSVEDMLQELEQASAGRFLAAKAKVGQVIHLQKAIRAGLQLDQVRMAGAWLAAGGDAWRRQIDTRAIGDLDAWIAQAKAWHEQGRPAIAKNGKTNTRQPSDFSTVRPGKANLNDL
jgi:hypothetical protein